MSEIVLRSWIPVCDGKDLVLVNLSATPNLPFEGTEVQSSSGGYWVLLEKLNDKLYLGGIDRTETYILVHQQTGENLVTGYAIKKRLQGKFPRNANVLDTLLDNQHLIPDMWKVYAGGIYFWGTIYYHSGGQRLYVRSLLFRDGKWITRYRWLGDSFGGDSCSAVQ